MRLTETRVARAAFRYRHRDIGFSDLMILAATERSRAHPHYTFDRKAAGLGGVHYCRSERRNDSPEDPDGCFSVT